MDMSGGAAVLEALAAIAELGLELDIAAVVPSTENMPSGSATRPGDIITQLNGKTVEVNNTDAEGRLILADALTWCVREMGADRVVDIATLTGAVVVALGSTYAALIANDDELAAAVEEAAGSTGELVWRLPLHPEYKELTKGTVADLTNSAAKRKAGTIYAGSFLEEFVDDKPWAHLDIAGTAWDTGREYVGKGPTGFGVRLLLALALGPRGRGLGQDVDPDGLGPALDSRRPAAAAVRPVGRRHSQNLEQLSRQGHVAAEPDPAGGHPQERRAAPRVAEVGDPEANHRRDRELHDVRQRSRDDQVRIAQVAVLDPDHPLPKADPDGRDLVLEPDHHLALELAGQVGPPAARPAR